MSLTPKEAKRKRLAVVRLSRVDKERLQSGELSHVHEAVREPQWNAHSHVMSGTDLPSTFDKNDDLLKESVPPHW